ncbi:CcdB family protein [Vibrio parahaemolyticus]
MSQFSLYKNNDKNTATAYPYFVDVQSELLDTLNTRLVIPLTPTELLEKKAPSHLCPVIHIDEGDFVILTHQMACDVRSYEALFTAQRVNHLYHQMNLGA